MTRNLLLGDDVVELLADSCSNILRKVHLVDTGATDKGVKRVRRYATNLARLYLCIPVIDFFALVSSTYSYLLLVISPTSLSFSIYMCVSADKRDNLTFLSSHRSC